jgi:hypothetical protein
LIRIAAGRNDPEPPPAPRVTVIPLAGDLVEEAMKRIGAKRFADWMNAKLGVDCGCTARQAKMNDLDRKLRLWLGFSQA